MIKEYGIKDWNSFIQTICEIANHQEYRMWYRGQADYEWGLIPSVQRPEYLPTVKIMKEQGGGCIINTSSMVSISGQPSGVAYPTSKTAVNGLTWSLARELGPSNIRVNAVAPGITKTDMVAALPEQVIAPLIKMIPLKLFQPLGQPWRLILFDKNENIVH